MRRLLSASLMIAVAMMATGQGQGLDKVPFGTSVNKKDVVQQPARVDQSTVYVGIADVTGKTADVTVGFPEGIGAGWLGTSETPTPGFSGGYGMMWDKHIDGDQLLDGEYVFDNHWWLLNLHNDSPSPLPAPMITATWADSTLSGISANPEELPITVNQTPTSAEWSMSELAPQGSTGGGMQGTLSTTTQIQDTYRLGFDVTREISGGREVRGGVTDEPRTFTLTFTSHDGTVADLAASITFTDQRPNPGPVTTSDVSCIPSGGRVISMSPAVFWKIGEAGDPAPEDGGLHSLTCTFKVTNSSPSPAYFTPSIVAGSRRLAESITGMGSISHMSAGETGDPIDRLGATVTFETGEPTTAISFDVVFHRTVLFSGVNAVGDSVPPVTTTTVLPHEGWNNAQMTVELHATDVGGSGVKQIWYQVQPAGTPPQPTWVFVSGDTATISDFPVPGATALFYYAEDYAGNRGTPSTVDIRIDTTAPTTTPATPQQQPTSIGGQNWWKGTSLTVMLNASDLCAPNVPCSLLRRIWYRLGDAAWTSVAVANSPNASAGITVTNSTTITFYAEDWAGNTGVQQPFAVNLDGTPPVTTATVLPHEGWNNAQMTVELHATDVGGSGVKQIWYQVQPAGTPPQPTWVFVSGDTATISDFPVPGATALFYYAEDYAGNRGTPSTVDIRIDTTPPSTTPTTPQQQPTSIGGQNWWKGTSLTVMLNASDLCAPNVPCSLLRRIWYRLGDASWTSVAVANFPNGSTGITVTNSTTITFYAEDSAGNTGVPQTFVVNLDGTPPELTVPSNLVEEAIGPSGAPVTFTVSATDAGSGLKEVTCTRASGSVFALGSTTVNCTATDALNFTTSRSFTVTVRDTTKPVIGTVTFSPGVLWPASHKLVSIALGVTASDAVTPAPACRVASVDSNEPLNGTGDGNTAADFAFSGMSLSLRAERAGNLNDRIYAVGVICTDAAGNESAPKSITVLVPHDQGKKK